MAPAIAAPSGTPAIPPMAPASAPSSRKRRTMAAREAPRARRIPISRRRSAAAMEKVLDDEDRDQQGEQFGDLEGDGERAGQRFHAAAEAGGGFDLVARAKRVEDAAAAVLDRD